MNVMLEKCVVPACLAKSKNDTPYCSDYHQSYDRATKWKYARSHHYAVLEDLAGGPVFLSPWGPSQEYWRQLHDCDRFSPEVCRNYEYGSDEDEDDDEIAEEALLRSGAVTVEQPPVTSPVLRFGEPAMPADVKVDVIQAGEAMVPLPHRSLAQHNPIAGRDVQNFEDHDHIGDHDVKLRHRFRGNHNLHPSGAEDIVFDDFDDDEEEEEEQEEEEGDDDDIGEDKNGNAHDDEIAEFSQSYREDPPPYFHKKMKMDERLFNKENSGKQRQYVRNSNQLALQTSGRNGSNNRRAAGEDHSKRESTQMRLTSTGGLAVPGIESSSGGGRMNDAGSSAGRGRSGEGDASRRHPPLPPQARHRGEDQATRTGSRVAEKEKSALAPSGLHWSEARGCYRKVDLAEASKEFTKKKRSFQPMLSFQPVRGVQRR